MFYALVIALFLSGPAEPTAAGQPIQPPVMIVSKTAYSTLEACQVDGQHYGAMAAAQDGVSSTVYHCIGLSDPDTEKKA